MRARCTPYRLLLFAALLLGTFALMAWFVLANLDCGRRAAHRRDAQQISQRHESQGGSAQPADGAPVGP